MGIIGTLSDWLARRGDLMTVGARFFMLGPLLAVGAALTFAWNEVSSGVVFWAAAVASVFACLVYYIAFVKASLDRGSGFISERSAPGSGASIATVEQLRLAQFLPTPDVRFPPIADVEINRHCNSMKGKLSFPERVGRSFRSDPFFSMWGIGALLLLMTLLLLLGQFGGQSAVVFWLSAAFGVAFLVWISLVLKWSRTKFLQRSEQRRRRANEKASADHG